MNRPNKKEKTYTDEGITNYVKYLYDLEKYCDELENTLYVALRETTEVHRALDKACEALANFDLAFAYNDVPSTKEKWKEWCLKDED